MKNFKNYFILTLVIIFLTSFTKADYGPWEVAPCYQGIDFCVKKNSFNEYSMMYEWSIKFKNRYTQTAIFNYYATAHTTTKGYPQGRIKIPAGGVKETTVLVKDETAIKVFLNNLRFGTDDWSTKSVPCDKQ